MPPHQSWVVAAALLIATAVSADEDCSTLPSPINSGSGAASGCAGAIWSSGLPAERYCKGDSGQKPWYAACCAWETVPENACVPKPGTATGSPSPTPSPCTKLMTACNSVPVCYTAFHDCKSSVPGASADEDDDRFAPPADDDDDYDDDDIWGGDDDDDLENAHECDECGRIAACRAILTHGGCTDATMAPTMAPTSPTPRPTHLTPSPTWAPTSAPTTDAPTAAPATQSPTAAPTGASAAPSAAPASSSPSTSPTTSAPSVLPTVSPTFSPTTAPTLSPTALPTTAPTLPICTTGDAAPLAQAVALMGGTDGAARGLGCTARVAAAVLVTPSLGLDALPLAERCVCLAQLPPSFVAAHGHPDLDCYASVEDEKKVGGMYESCADKGYVYPRCSMMQQGRLITALGDGLNATCRAAVDAFVGRGEPVSRAIQCTCYAQLDAATARAVAAETQCFFSGNSNSGAGARDRGGDVDIEAAEETFAMAYLSCQLEGFMGAAAKDAAVRTLNGCRTATRCLPAPVASSASSAKASSSPLGGIASWFRHLSLAWIVALALGGIVLLALGIFGFIVRVNRRRIRRQKRRLHPRLRDMIMLTDTSSSGAAADDGGEGGGGGGGGGGVGTSAKKKSMETELPQRRRSSSSRRRHSSSRGGSSRRGQRQRRYGRHQHRRSSGGSSSAMSASLLGDDDNAERYDEEVAAGGAAAGELDLFGGGEEEEAEEQQQQQV